MAGPMRQLQERKALNLLDDWLRGCVVLRMQVRPLVKQHGLGLEVETRALIRVPCVWASMRNALGWVERFFLVR
eukprot:3960530-Amphidinium_carterae.1